MCLERLRYICCRLGYFERKHSFYDKDQLMAEITRHYSQQASHFISAFYSLEMIDLYFRWTADFAIKV